MTVFVSLVVSLVSAFIPVINAEAYLGAIALANPGISAFPLALAGAVGQMAGKYVWYLGAANATRWRWLRKYLADPKRQAAYDKWRTRVHDRPVAAGVGMFLSAFIGIPPLAITPIIAGHLRMNVWLFLVVGLIGRWLRFQLIIMGVGLIPSA